MSHELSVEALCHVTRLEYDRMEIYAKEFLMTHPFLMSLPLFVNPSVFLRIAVRLRGFLFPFSFFATTSLGFITLDTIFKLGPLQHGGS